MEGNLMRVRSDLEPAGKWRFHRLSGTVLSQYRSPSDTRPAREVYSPSPFFPPSIHRSIYPSVHLSIHSTLSTSEGLSTLPPASSSLPP